MKTKLVRAMATLIAAAVIATTMLSSFAVAASAEGNPALSRWAASEGMILLENRNDVLPVAEGSTVAMFGRAMIDYVRGGGGSGNTNVDYTINILQGMQEYEQDGKVTLVPKLVDFYTEQVTTNGITDDASIAITDEVWSAASSSTETAVVTIGRYAAEGTDRQAVKGDYYLSDAETELITKVAAEFENTVVVLNIGGVIDTSWIKGENAIDGVDAVLVAWQGGMEGGGATADVLMGTVNPSGKTVDTWAADYTDYPSSETFNESAAYVNYTEDIFVGYRYFETIPAAYDKVNYEFGYGLSYTSFETVVDSVEVVDENIVTTVTVTNTGDVAGKEVVQVYFSAPRGDLTKPAKELAAFDKTDLLEAGASQTLTLSFPITDMSSYDDTGVIQKSAYVMEAGEYTFFIGNSVRDGAYSDVVYTLTEDVVAEQLSELCAPIQLAQRLTEDGTYVSAQRYTNVSATAQTKIEMEYFSAASSAVKTETFNNNGLINGTCVANMNSVGDYVEYALNAEKEGRYAIYFSYANNYGAKNDIFSVFVNDVEQENDTYNIVQTGVDGNLWYNFMCPDSYILVDLAEGENIIRFTAKQTNLPNFDYFNIEYVGEEEIPYETRVYSSGRSVIQMEDYVSVIEGTPTGGHTSKTSNGITFVENFNYSNSPRYGCTLTYNFYVEKAGTYKLALNANYGSYTLSNIALTSIVTSKGETTEFDTTFSLTTTNWSTFVDTPFVEIELPAGNCEFSFKLKENPNNSVPNIDYFWFYPADETEVPYEKTVAATGITKFEAETYDATVIGSNHVIGTETSNGITVVNKMNSNGNTVKYNLYVREAGTYNLLFYTGYNSGSQSYKAAVNVESTNTETKTYETTWTVQNTGWWTFVPTPVMAVELPKGNCVLSLTCKDTIFPNIDYLTLEKAADVALLSETDNTVDEQSTEKLMLIDVYNDASLMDEFLAQMSLEDLANLLSAQETRDGSTTWGFGKNKDYGIPLIMTADGPQGIRINKNCTAWPIATCLAASWDVDVVAAVGKAVATEAHNNNMDVWLAPGLNIHRDPLCGRNFEYYSEDPLVSGKFAAATSVAVQAEGVAVTIKHFAANNKEENRKNSNSRVSERALREIYLRGFEIAIKEGDAWSVMSSYNMINGVQNGENYELLTGILRDEWGFDGVLFTDWQNNTMHVSEVLAGNDLKMTNSHPEQLVTAVEQGILTREQLEAGVTRVLNLVMKVNYFKDRMVNTPVVEITDGSRLKAADNIMWSEIAYSQTTTDTDGGNHLAYCNVGAYTEYEINVANGGYYSISARVASPAGEGTFDMLIDGQKICTVNAVNTGSYSTWGTTEDSEAVMLEEGRHTLTLEFTASGMNLNWLEFTKINVVNETTGELYMSVSDALTNAAPGDTVKLENNTTVGYAIVSPGVTLDLNGYELTADYLIGLNDSNVVDNSADKTGKVYVEQNKATLNKNNSQISIYDTEKGCYVFVTVKTISSNGNLRYKYELNTETQKYEYSVSPVFGESLTAANLAHGLLSQNSEATGIKVVIRVTWTSETYNATQDFAYKAETVQNVVNSFNVNNDNNYDLKFTAIFADNGLVEATDVKVSTVVISDTGAEAQSGILDIDVQ